MRITRPKDLFSGLIFLGAGLAFAIGARNYDIGSARQMGPGYFPLVLGGLVALVGAILCGRSIALSTPEAPIGRWALRPLACVIGANALFAMMLAGMPAWGIPALGFIPSVMVLVLVAGLGSDAFTLRTFLPLAAGLAVATYVVFVRLLGMQFDALPALAGG
jgi:hypothetical protein